MPLTPTDVANKQFKISFRGYSLDEVDGFLDEVESELGRLMRENAELRAAPPKPAAPPVFQQPVQTAPAPEPVAAPVAPVAPVDFTEEGQQAALRTLLLAQRTADDTVAEARAEAAGIVRAAEARAADIDNEIARRLHAAMGGVEERKRTVEREIEELRVFEREYRVRLKAYLESQLSDISGRGAPDDAGGGVPAAARSAAITGGSALAGRTSSASPPSSPPASPPASPPSSAPDAPRPAVPRPEADAPARPPAAPAPQPPTASPAPAPTGSPAAPPVAPPAASPPRLSYSPVPPPSAPAGPTGPPAGPPRESAPRVAPAPAKADEPIGPFTIVPPSVFAEQLDEGPEPPAS